jgi:predicted nucleic acid-binding protein
MRVKVVDAAALGAIAFGEPQAEAMAKRLSGGLLVAPLLLWFELSSICLKKIRKQPEQKEQLLEAFQLAQRLPIEKLFIYSWASLYSNLVDVFLTATLTRLTKVFYTKNPKFAFVATPLNSSGDAAFHRFFDQKIY